MMDRLNQQQKVNNRITSPLIFLSYAEEDKAYCESFIRHMREPVRQQMFTLWQPHNIAAGLNRENEITSRLQQASLILLMLSSDYLADDTCYQQMRQAIEIGQQETERVCVILLRPCNWRSIAGIERFHVLPRSDRAISLWSTTDHDDVIQGIVAEIVQLVTKVRHIPIELSNSSVLMPTIQTSPAPLDLPALEKKVGKSVVSRRTAIIGFASIMIVTAVGAGGFIILHRQPSLGQLLLSYQGHFERVNAAAWSHDGRRIASGSDDKTVQVWNADDGSNILTYREHDNVVRAVTWSPDGQRIASCSLDKTVRIWSANNGSGILTYTGHSNGVWFLAWSPNGQRIASCSLDKTVQVWNANNGSNILTYTKHSDTVWFLAWSPDGRQIVSSSQDMTVRVWNVNDGSNVLNYTGHSSLVGPVKWSPDGKQIASGSDDKTVQIWNASDGNNVFTYRGHSHWVYAVAWSPDGERIASGSYDKTVQIWNAQDGSNSFTYRGHTSAVWSVAWSPDGKQIASASADGTVQVWYVG